MSVIFLLIGFSLVIALVFLGAFVWANRSGQYDDDYTPAVRMLFDDPVRTPLAEDDQPDKSSNNQAEK